MACSRNILKQINMNKMMKLGDEDDIPEPEPEPEPRDPDEVPDYIG